MSGQQLQQHLQEVGDIFDKIVASGAGEPSVENNAVAAISALPNATADDTPSSDSSVKQAEVRGFRLVLYGW